LEGEETDPVSGVREQNPLVEATLRTVCNSQPRTWKRDNVASN